MSTIAFWSLFGLLLLVGAPLFLLIGGATVLAFVLISHVGFADLASSLLERIRSLADQQTLLAIPFFMLSGTVMAAGDISARLIRFARALVGWLPGGMALSGIGAFLLFASVTGSSAATLVAIGGLVYPALRKEGYREDFSIGLVTTAGSLGILVPPSIPMIIYCLFNTSTKVEVEKLFLGGVGPALLIAGSLGLYSMVSGARQKVARYRFSFRQLATATHEGFWSLLLPGLILGGIYSGLFTAVEAAAVSAVYALLVEVYLHGGLGWKDVPRLFSDTVTLVGSFIVIIVMAMGLGDFFTVEGIPERAAAWITELHLTPFWFLLAVDLLLLVVGCLMDIMSALMVFVPLIAPMAAAIGIDPVHLGIVFIVNLEVGYLTPPVGLNLFLAASLFDKSFGQVLRYTAPFVLLMLGCLAAVTWVPSVTLLPLEWAYGYQRLEPPQERASDPTPAAPSGEPQSDKPGGKVRTLKELMEDDAPAPAAPRVRSMKELMDEADERPAEPAGTAPRVKTMKELMDEAE